MPQGAGRSEGEHRPVTILCCVDSRLEPHQFVPTGAEHVWYYRNAGGRVTDDFVRTFLITQLNGCRHVMVVHHTGCGLHAASNARFRERMREELHVDATSVDFLPWADLEEGVREDVRKLKQSPFVVREVAVTGHVYDLKAGQLRDVDVP
jgi:carbonic anhydrase